MFDRRLQNVRERTITHLTRGSVIMSKLLVYHPEKQVGERSLAGLAESWCPAQHDHQIQQKTRLYDLHQMHYKKKLNYKNIL